jgi:DNA-binding transcriptional ArsR family regulator
MPNSLQGLKGDLFRALAHPTRIRILERLVAGERTVHELQQALELDQPIVSQHLAALRAKSIVTVRREGTLAYYAVRSPLVADLLRVARELLNDHLSESQSMLRELQREQRRDGTSRA